MARVVEPLLVQPTKTIATSVAEFEAHVDVIIAVKKKIADATEEKNTEETALIDEFFGRKAKGSITLKAAGHEVKVEFNRSIKSDLKGLSDALPKTTFDLVFPPKREFSASAHNAHLKALEAASHTNDKKKVEFEEYLLAIASFVTSEPTKPSVKID